MLYGCILSESWKDFIALDWKATVLSSHLHLKISLKTKAKWEYIIFVGMCGNQKVGSESVLEKPNEPKKRRNLFSKCCLPTYERTDKLWFPAVKWYHYRCSFAKLLSRRNENVSKVWTLNIATDDVTSHACMQRFENIRKRFIF